MSVAGLLRGLLLRPAEPAVRADADREARADRAVEQLARRLVRLEQVNAERRLREGNRG